MKNLDDCSGDFSEIQSRLRNFIYWTRLFVLLVVAGMVCVPRSAEAQKPKVPTGVPGYDVRLQQVWEGFHSGYLPIRIKIATNPPRTLKESRLFTVRLLPQHRSRQGYQQVSGQLVIPAGKSEAEVEIYYPVGVESRYRSVELLIEAGGGDGRFQPQRDLLQEYSLIHTNWSDSLHPNVLLVSSAVSSDPYREWVCYRDQMKESTTGTSNLNLSKNVPSLERLEEVYGLQTISRSSRSTRISNQSSIQNSQFLECCSLAGLPDLWLGLSVVDELLISLGDLKMLVAKWPKRADALSKWVAAGGALVVFDLGESYGTADKIFSLLHSGQESRLGDPTERRWLKPSKGLSGVEQLIRAGSIHDREEYYSSEALELNELDDNFRDKAISRVAFLDQVDKGTPYLVARYLNGQVVAVSGDMEQWKAEDWMLLQNGIAIVQEGQLVSRKSLSGWVRSFRVPGVGEPPLVAFQVLIGLFIVLAGPLMVVVLRRMGRLQLMFLLVPVLSVTACLGLVAYAVLVDGFDTWGNVQSVTRMDHRSGVAVTRARCAYYAGVNPGPYSYALDTVARFPVADNQQGWANAVLKNGRLEFAGGNIRSRTRHQVTTERSYHTSSRLVVLDQVSGDGAARKVWVNRLGADVRYAVAATEDGWVEIENLADGQRSEGVVVDAEGKSVVDVKLFRLLGSMSPQPTGNVAGLYGNASMEQRVIEVLRDEGVSELLAEPNCYIAILESFPEIENQLESVNYKNQLHVIIGTW